MIAGPDPDDPATADIPEEMSLDFEAGLEEATLEGLRLGVPNQHVGYNAALDEIFESQLSRLEAAGVEIVEVKDHPWFLGCQFHPEFASTPFRPHPLFVAFVGAALAQSAQGGSAGR